jgi:Bacterial regulatory proteins, lacI family
MPVTRTVVNLRTVADRVGLAPCSVSAILNSTPASLAIPQRTKDRVFRAAARLNYRPNLSARSLRTKRTHLVAVISDDFGQEQVAQVVAGMERRLRSKGYLLALGAIENPSEWNSLTIWLNQRGIEGVIAVGTRLPRDLAMPGVLVDLTSLKLEPLSDAARESLTRLGESAADAIVRKIENASPQTTQLATKIGANVPNVAARVTAGVPGLPARSGLAERVLPMDQIGPEIVRADAGHTAASARV